MKRLGVFILPPGWDASPSQGYPQHYASTHLYTWVERGTVRVKCLAQEHTQCPRPRTRATRSGVERTNHEATTAFLLRTFAGKYLIQFVIEIPIQILIIFYPPSLGRLWTNAISDSCSLRNWQKWIFCGHGPEDWVRLSGGDYGKFVVQIVNR